MSDLREVLSDIHWPRGDGYTERLIDAIIDDGRIGILPTRSQVLGTLSHDLSNSETADNFVGLGYAREDDEPMTTPDPDSASVDAIAKVLANIRSAGIPTNERIARSVLAYLREHPEHGPWPVMTVGEVTDFYWHGEEQRIEEWIALLAGNLITPDPDPPAAAVPSVEAMQQLVEAACIEYHRSPGIKGNYAVLMNAIKYLVEAANGGGAK